MFYFNMPLNSNATPETSKQDCHQPIMLAVFDLFADLDLATHLDYAVFAIANFV